MDYWCYKIAYTLGKGALFEKVRYFVIFYIKSIKYNKISYFLDYILDIMWNIDIFKKIN